MSERIVSRVGNQAVIELSSAKIPVLGSPVISGGMKIGTVFDVIGSVEKPYVVVRLSAHASPDVVGRSVSWGG
jgi:rRNA processing protein Gar1